MNTDQLVRMANQISLFFESQPAREDAVAGVHDHLKRFWDPRMRAAIVRHLEAGGNDLREVASAAVARLATETRNAATRAT